MGLISAEGKQRNVEIRLAKMIDKRLIESRMVGGTVRNEGKSG